MRTRWLTVVGLTALLGLSMALVSTALPDSCPDTVYAAGTKGKISGPLTTVAPVDAMIELMEKLNKDAAQDIEDEELERAGVKFAVIMEMASLQTLRQEADLKAWAAKMVKVYRPVAVDDPNAADAKTAVAEGKKLLAEGQKNAKSWASAKPGSGDYTPANQSLKLLMSYVGVGHDRMRKAIGQPGINLQKAQIPSGWAIAEIGNISILFSKNKDWRDWSAAHRDNYAETVKTLAKGDPNGARKFFDNAQANCKACHDKYQSDAPIGN